MTETSKHTQPLARGEIRRHTVGAQTFQIMHALAGGYVQVAIRAENEPTHVVCLEMAMDEHKALAAYAELIRIAELIAAPVIDAHGEALIEDWQRVRSAHLASAYGKPAAAPGRGDSEAEDTTWSLTPEGMEALRVRAGFEPTMASETNPHPTAPGGIWDTMGTCPECGTPTGFPCVEVEIWSDGKRLQAYPHTNRLSTKPEFAAPPIPAPTLAASAALAETFGGAIVDPADALPTPAPTLADRVDMTGVSPAADRAWVGERDRAGKMTHVEADAYYATLEQQSATPAPTRADDVAALRAEIEKIVWISEGDASVDVMLEILDRIAGAVPQRAEPWPGALPRMHECGQVESFPNDAPPDGSCDRCESGSNNPGDWRALYVLPGQ